MLNQVPDDGDAVNQPETKELQSELELKATEAEHMFSPVEDKRDVTDGKTSNLAPILAAAQQVPEVAFQEILQPQSTAVLVPKEQGKSGREYHFISKAGRTWYSRKY